MISDVQRISLVLEHNFDEDTWMLVAYLIHDTGHRERCTLSEHDNRQEASESLVRFWQKAVPTDRAGG